MAAQAAGDADRVKTMAEMLMSAEADSVCGAACRRPSPERPTQRN